MLVMLPNTSRKAFAKPSVSANNAVLMEQSTGRVLYEKAANKKQSIASITKIMTAILAVESGKLNETVTTSRRAAYTEGSSIYLKEGEKMKLKDLVYGLMLRSGNDSAVAIAEYLGGSVEGFAYLMNEKAAWLGMTNTNFDNPHGLDSDTHYSTAYDMALLMRYAMENETFREITGAKSYKAETRTYSWRNKNKMLTKYYKYSIGGKTGYTRKTGRTLVSVSKKENMELIAVTLDAPDDWNDHTRLFEWGYDTYDLSKIDEKGKETYQMTGTEQSESGYILQDLVVPLSKDEKGKVKENIYIEREKTDEKIGEKVYSIDGEVIAETGIYQKQQETEEEDTGFWNEFTQLIYQTIGVS
ncbi:D-alanyl-D-alanine carboxypeptidase family protein [Terrihalobacillus insolitus]|uniref:D-alanyl-D-alanine carboxypeptidase family protein n=1 Tax=Terrihalobacillus insolitus TaxID=2950438 RepID=UPI003A8F058D